MADIISQIKLPDNKVYDIKDNSKVAKTGDTMTGNLTAPKFIGALDEANLTWGGKNFSASYGCIDAALMDELGANRFQFIKADAITVEYTRDGGTTWTDYGATNTQKQQIFAQGGGLIIGKADSTHKATEHPGLYQLRITIDTGVAGVYTYLNKFIIYVGTNGSANCICKIQKALQSTPTTFIDHTDWIPIGGWSGYNVLNVNSFATYGNSPSSQYGRVRFIFKDGTGGNTNYIGLSVSQIKAFGGVGWSTPSTMAKTGHIYSYDENQNVTFSGNVTAPKFIGALQGNANTASNAQTVNGHTVNSDVPSNATFTDTTYTFANGTNGFTVTPSGGTAQTVTVTPSITNNVTGSGTSGYLAKFNGANTITNGAQLGSDTTKFLRNDGEWAVPPGAGGGVTGVKGNAESTYRTGNVNLTPANLGLESKPAASGGTDLSLVTTHEKYVWNNKATTDENVKQTQISTSINSDYPILGGYPYDTSSPHIRGTYYSDDITITGHSLIIGATGASAAGYNSLAIGSGGTYESMLCAGGDNSIAVGEHVCSSAKNQLVFGRWNREDPTVWDTHPMGIRFDHERNSSEGQYVEIVGNGTSLQNTSNARTLDWSGNEWLAGTLTASGATINGSISVSDNILSDDSSLDITTSAPSSDYWSQYGIYFRDTNQTEFGRVRGYYLTDGEVGVEYETKRTVGGTVKYNNLNLGIDSSGNNVVSVSSPSAWRTALGLKDWVEVDHKGGTTAIPIPSGTTEICCVITVGNNTIAWTFTLPYVALSSTSWRYTNAYTSVSDGYIAVNVSTAQVSLNAVYNGKSNVTSSSILYLYAR